MTLPISTTAHDLLDGVAACPPLGLVPLGKVFWVDSATGSDTLGDGSFASPLKTISGALAKCVSARGDTILVRPGYAETQAANLTISKTQVAIIGLGLGVSRPRMTMPGTSGSWIVTGAGTSIVNIDFLGSGSSNSLVLDIDADRVLVDGCRFWHDAAGIDVDSTIELTGADCTVQRCRILYSDGITPFNDDAIHLNGACERCTIRRNFIHGVFTNAAIYGGANSNDLLIEQNLIINLQNVQYGIINLDAGANGIIRHNVGRHAYATLSDAIQPRNCAVAENYFTNDATKSAAITPGSRST